MIGSRPADLIEANDRWSLRPNGWQQPRPECQPRRKPLRSGRRPWMGKYLRGERGPGGPICSLLSLRAKCCINSVRVMPLGRSRSALRISSATGSPSVSPNTGARPRGGGLRYVPWCPRHRPLAPPQGAAVVRRAGRAVRPRGRGAGPTWVPRARRPTLHVAPSAALSRSWSSGCSSGPGEKGVWGDASQPEHMHRR